MESLTKLMWGLIACCLQRIWPERTHARVIMYPTHVTVVIPTLVGLVSRVEI